MEGRDLEGYVAWRSPARIETSRRGPSRRSHLAVGASDHQERTVARAPSPGMQRPRRALPPRRPPVRVQWREPAQLRVEPRARVEVAQRPDRGDDRRLADDDCAERGGGAVGVHPGSEGRANLRTRGWTPQTGPAFHHPQRQA